MRSLFVHLFRKGINQLLRLSGIILHHMMKEIIPRQVRPSVIVMVKYIANIVMYSVAPSMHARLTL